MAAGFYLRTFHAHNNAPRSVVTVTRAMLATIADGCVYENRSDRRRLRRRVGEAHR